MKTLVIDVAAELGGALTVLEHFISLFSEDISNQYIVVLSKPQYKDSVNTTFINIEWVKRSHLHRLYFDNIYIRKLIHMYHPDRILSLQNKTVNAGKLEQYVYFHNALPLSQKKYSILESKNIWIYQRIIGKLVKHSLNHATIIYVQAQWIKREMITQWKIQESKIHVIKPEIDEQESILQQTGIKREEGHMVLFYPAGFEIYKNHLILYKALKNLCYKNGIKNCPTLVLTGNKDDMPQAHRHIIDDNQLPIIFKGRLNRQEMIDQYKHSILVFPSQIETVGLPLLEAKQLGRTIIAADCEYAHETLGDYPTYYFDPENALELSDIIESIFQRE